MCVYIPYKFQNQIRNTPRETKRKICYVNSVILWCCVFVILFFCFSKCIPNLVLEILGIVNPYIVNIKKFI
jgi:hypothetical protein